MESSNTSLKALQRMLSRIYDEHDRRFYDDKDLLLRVNEELSKIDELVRKENIAGVIKNLPRLFVWLMAFVDRVGVDVAEALWKKYPRVCPYCLKDRNCMCITQDIKYAAERPELIKFRAKREDMPQSLAEWQQSLANIYGRVNKITMLIQVWLHVSEEVGEICAAYRLKLNHNLEEEIADAAAWILSTATKLNVNLQDMILKQYPGRCDVCGQERCQCEIV